MHTEALNDNTRHHNGIEFAPWYPQTLPESLSQQGSLNTAPSETLNGGVYDLVIVGGGIAGCSAALRAAKLASRTHTGPEPFNILLLDRDKVFGGLSSITGGLFTGLEIDSHWLSSGIGKRACDEFNRRIFMSIAATRRMAAAFDRDYGDLGLNVISASRVNMLIDHPDKEEWVKEEINYLNDLFGHDKTHHSERLDQGKLSLASLTEEFTSITRMKQSALPPAYQSGYTFPGEFSVNPAAFALMMRTQLHDDFGPHVKLHIQEKIDVTAVHAASGMIEARASNRDAVSFYGRKILLAGTPRTLVQSSHFLEEAKKTPAKSYRTLIAVTDPLPQHLRDIFRDRAFHDTSHDYRYGWLHEPTGELVVGHSDFDVFPDISPQTMIKDSKAAVRALLGDDIPIHHIWAGDIPNSKDGIAHVHREDRVLWIGHAGGRSLAAHTALGNSAASALLNPGGREDRFLHMLEGRKKDYDAFSEASTRPDYLIPAAFLCERNSPIVPDAA